MTEIGNDQIEEIVKSGEIDPEVVDKIAKVMEERAIAEKAPEYAEIVNPAQVEALLAEGLESKEDIRALTDEELVKIDGIGAATVTKLREWGIEDVEKGNAIARCFLALKSSNERDENGDKLRLNVRPGDVIPTEYGAEELVEKGQASWS